MKTEIKKAEILCPDCGYMLLVVEDKIICQYCKKQVRPK